MPPYLTPITIFKGVAIRADTGSRTVGTIRDWASPHGLQAALRQPECVLGWKVVLLCGVAAAWHRRAGKELERDFPPRCSEEGPAPRVLARRLAGESVDLQAPLRPDLIENGPAELHDLVSESARAGVEDGFDERRGEDSSGGSAVACPLGSTPL